jgi:hypothetical protein
LLAATLGLGLSCGALVVSALALWKPALVASWGAVAHLQHPALFATGLALVSLGGANWFGRAWHLRRQGGWAVFGRGLLGLIQMAVAAALLVAGLVWLMGHMGDPGPKGYQERYGEHGSSAPSWPRPTSVRTPSL